jgi:hypothetical protein
MAKKKVHFEIDKDSIIKGTGAGEGQGYMYCTTTPPHPEGEVRSDRQKRYIYLHRVIMENHLGRLLKDWEEVHHKDEDSTNNALSNLELSDKRTHQRQHSKKNKFWKTSPKNKPKKASVLRVLAAYLTSERGTLS